MQISWINTFSLIDYPGEISCIVFTPWCNFRCAFCHNSEFVLPEKLKYVYKNLIDEKIFFNFLEKRKWLLSWVSICGWEPTLQSDLVEFCKKVKSMWFNVKLDTNWRDPSKIGELIDKSLVDYVAMDIKNEIWKFSDSACVKVLEKPYLESIDLLLNSNINYEFRTTVIKWVHNIDTIENISKYIKWAKNYYIQNYKSWNDLDENFKWLVFENYELVQFENIAKKYIKSVKVRD